MSGLETSSTPALKRQMIRLSESIEDKKLREARCRGGPDVIRKAAWPFYRTISGVRLCWELEEPKGPQGSVAFRHDQSCAAMPGTRKYVHAHQVRSVRP